MRILQLSLWVSFLCAVAFSQLLPVTIVDINGDSAVHQIASVGTAKWIQFVAPTTNTGVVRVGDSGITSTRGVPMVAGSGFMMPFAQNLPAYSLASTYYLVSTGDKLSISWVK